MQNNMHILNTENVLKMFLKCMGMLNTRRVAISGEKRREKNLEMERVIHSGCNKLLQKKLK